MKHVIQKRPFNQLTPLNYKIVEITDKFWKKRQELNKNISLPLILKNLKKDHHIENLRVAAGLEDGTFVGDFYFDSDLYKWLEGAFHFSQFNLSDEIEQEIKEIVNAIQKAQWRDGYLNSYYSINFPQKRFTNLLMFHELYCGGHLIEAALAEKSSTGIRTLLNVAENFTNLLVRQILKPQLKDTAGHPEIELALIKLYRETNKRSYLDLCQHLIKMRGRIPHLRTYIMRRLIDTLQTFNKAEQVKNEYFKSHNKGKPPKEEVAEFLENLTIKDWTTYIRNNLNGKIYQLDTPIREAYNPVGHAVRALYLYCGVADLYSETGDNTLLHALELIWLKMVKARMFITGGVGSNKAYEGFEKDFKLNINNSYSETCAAIANIMWNWRMFLITGKCKYTELIERLLYNAMLVGQSLDGKRYFYANPMVSQGKERREEWFKCPCCPTNYIRIIPQLGKYIYAKSKKGIYITQYIGSNTSLDWENGAHIEIKQKSRLPWEGKVEIKIDTNKETSFSLFFRIPRWCEDKHIYVNGEQLTDQIESGNFLQIRKKWSDDTISLEFEMIPHQIEGNSKRKDLEKKVVLSYGPLIYCLEQKDNNFDIFNAKLPKQPKLGIERDSELLDNMIIIYGTTKLGKEFKAIPYFAWNNRGSTQMLVWFKKEV
jgi:hypothetical protein